MLMMAPPPAARRCGIACLQPRKTPSRLTAWMRRHSSRLGFSMVPAGRPRAGGAPPSPSRFAGPSLSRAGRGLDANGPNIPTRPETVVLEHLAQFRLQDLAGRGVRDFGDEDDVVRELPLGEVIAEIAQDVVLVLFRALAQGDDEERALAPARMRQADHRRLGDGGMADGGGLDIDRADPFAARLDDVLAAVDDLDVAVLLAPRDVARAQPSRT